jgi:hypothetical protein
MHPERNSVTTEHQWLLRSLTNRAISVQGLASSSTCLVLVARDLSAPFLGFFFTRR